MHADQHVLHSLQLNKEFFITWEFFFKVSGQCIFFQTFSKVFYTLSYVVILFSIYNLMFLNTFLTKFTCSNHFSSVGSVRKLHKCSEKSLISGIFCCFFRLYWVYSRNRPYPKSDVCKMFQIVFEYIQEVSNTIGDTHKSFRSFGNTPKYADNYLNTI